MSILDWEVTFTIAAPKASVDDPANAATIFDQNKLSKLVAKAPQM